MNPVLPHKSPYDFDQLTLDKICDSLHNQGFIVLTQSINQLLLNQLEQRIQQIPDNQWQAAGIGRHQQHQLNSKIRSDKIAWISAANIVESEFLNCMEKLRQGINQRLFLGLFDYESHFAIYPEGSYYQKHLDALKGQSNRVVSTVLYLNNDWLPENKGELIIFSDKKNLPTQSVSPQMGTMVIFLSQQIPHEVIKANRQRFSIAGWFRINASDSHWVDPAF